MKIKLRKLSKPDGDFCNCRGFEPMQATIPPIIMHPKDKKRLLEAEKAGLLPKAIDIVKEGKRN